MTKLIPLLIVFTFSPVALCLEVVKFQSEPGPHSPFKIKRAKAKGETLPPKERIELTGFLGRPKAQSKSPAIILLHSGFGLQEYHRSWATQLTESGYVTLLIYSYADKKASPMPKINMSRDVVSNAYGAYEYLRKRDFVDKNRIGVMGWSSGARHAFSLIAEDPPPGRQNQKSFKAGAMVYPNCPPGGGRFQSPMLILLGDNDQYLVKGDCERFKKETQKQNKDQVVDMHLYRGVTHFYDDAGQPPQGSQDNKSTRYRYSPDAHQDSLFRARQFFDQYLKKDNY